MGDHGSSAPQHPATACRTSFKVDLDILGLTHNILLHNPEACKCHIYFFKQDEENPEIQESEGIQHFEVAYVGRHQICVDIQLRPSVCYATVESAPIAKDLYPVSRPIDHTPELRSRPKPRSMISPCGLRHIQHLHDQWPRLLVVYMLDMSVV